MKIPRPGMWILDVIVFAGAILILFLVAGCVSPCAKASVSPEIPLRSEFVRIANKEYKMFYQDCSNLSAEYATLLHEEGYKTWVYVIYTYNLIGLHTVVGVEVKDEMRYYDLTQYRGSTSCITDWGVVLHRIPADELQDSIFAREFIIREPTK